MESKIQKLEALLVQNNI